MLIILLDSNFIANLCKFVWRGKVRSKRNVSNCLCPREGMFPNFWINTEHENNFMQHSFHHMHPGSYFLKPNQHFKSKLLFPVLGRQPFTGNAVSSPVPLQLWHNAGGFRCKAKGMRIFGCLTMGGAHGTGKHLPITHVPMENGNYPSSKIQSRIIDKLQKYKWLNLSLDHEFFIYLGVLVSKSNSALHGGRKIQKTH